MKPTLTALTMTLAASVASAEDRPVLEVYTYDSFVSEWGPGPAIEIGFEETCGCDLKFTGVGDGAALLARLKLEGTRTDADVVLGMDTNLTAAAIETGLFARHTVTRTDWAMPVTWDDPYFVPYDWGYFAFVHGPDVIPPTNFRDLAASDTTLLIQDPRSSTPGLGLLLWIKAAYGDESAAIWEELSDNIVTVTKGWSEAYGLFLENEADMVLSYTTSPAYHLIAEDDTSKSAALFDEGHYLQIEVAGAIASSDQLDLAQEFLSYLTSDAAQSVLPTTNWMYPAAPLAEGLPAGFDTLIAPETALIYPASEAQTIRNVALDEWLTALSR